MVLQLSDISTFGSFDANSLQSFWDQIYLGGGSVVKLCKQVCELVASATTPGPSSHCSIKHPVLVVFNRLVTGVKTSRKSDKALLSYMLFTCAAVAGVG